VLKLPTTNFTHFEDVLDVYANTIRLRPRPAELVFVSAKSTSTAAAPGSPSDRWQRASTNGPRFLALGSPPIAAALREAARLLFA
jgi:hypothetical protein